jgi:hypothetical protein
MYGGSCAEEGVGLLAVYRDYKAKRKMSRCSAGSKEKRSIRKEIESRTKYHALGKKGCEDAVLG